MSQKYEKLKTLLQELFQLDQPDLEEDMSVEGLLAGKPSGESQSSLLKMACRQKPSPHETLQPTLAARLSSSASPPRPMCVRLKAPPAADIGSAWRQSPARALMMTMETTD